MKKTTFIAGLFACIFSIGCLHAQEKYTKENNPVRKLQLAQFAIANLYVDQVDDNKLVESAIKGMLEELDPHSTYSTPEEVKRMNEPLQGNFDGITSSVLIFTPAITVSFTITIRSPARIPTFSEGPPDTG